MNFLKVSFELLGIFLTCSWNMGYVPDVLELNNMQMKHKDSQCFEADFSESETIAKPDTLHKTTSETSMSNNQLTFVMTGNRFDTHVPKTVSTC